MNTRDRRLLALALEEQGARIRKTKKGFMAMNPKTTMTVSWHAGEASDTRRADKNLKKDLIGAGFSYPF